MPGKNQCRLQGGLGRHAFTLIEIIVAMTIIAVIAAVAIPTLKGLNEDEQRRAILVSIAEMVQTVRDRAMQERHPYEIVLEQGGLHAIPGNRSFYKREEFLEYLEKLRTPPVISDIARATMETTNVARNVPAPGAGAAPLPNQSTEGTGLAQGPQSPEMPWTRTIIMEGAMKCQVLMWGDGEWDDLSGERIRCWVFQPNGMASPARLRLLSGGMELEAAFDVLTGEMTGESSLRNSGPAQP